jgi:hypothetical protein
MTPETTITPDATASNFFSRLSGIYFSPGETFKEIGRNPSFWIPLLALMLVGGLGAYMLIERMTVPGFFGAQFDQAVAQGSMTQEQATQQVEAMSKYATWVKVGFFAWGFVQWAIIPLALAGIAKLITMVLGTENKFKPVFTVTVYALLAVAILSTLVFVVTLYLKPVDEIDLRTLSVTSLGSFLTMLLGKDGLPKFIMALAGWIDLFAIWMIALLSIGYAAVSRKLKTSTVAFALGGLYAVIAIIGSIFAAMRG